MTIEEAIIENNAMSLVKTVRARCGHDDAEECRECAREHKQLAEWLKELIRYRNALEKITDEINSFTGVSIADIEVIPKDDVIEIIRKNKEVIEK